VIDGLTGLSQSAALQRLQADGPNLLPSAKSRSLLAIARTILQEPMFILLIGCGAIYLLLGNQQDAYILLASVLIIMGMTLAQEHKSERALEALRDLSSPRALVLRDGQPQHIPGSDVVRGDVIFLAEGDRVPADAVLLTSQNMSIDESLLSGESVPVRKVASAETPTTMQTPGGEDTAFLYSGSLVVQGTGQALVLATGANTTLGRIGNALFTLQTEPSHLQLETGHAVKVVALWSSALVLLLTLWYGMSRGDWLNGILAGLTMAMALLPAELPLILTIFLALGAWRMAKAQVLTRRISAIEMLGAATVLCVDKTGTLTQNRMAVAQLVVNAEVYAWPAVADVKTATAAMTDKDVAPQSTQQPVVLPEILPVTLPEAFHETLEFAMLSSHRDPFDPMEQAIKQAGHTALAGTEHIHDSWTLIEDYPLSPALLAMSRVWQSPDLADYVIAAKGAPEAIFDLCHLPAAQVEQLTAQVNQAAAQGLRVLAVAKASFGHTDLPEIQHDFVFSLIGLIALADPLRPTARGAIAECRAAGIRVMMITGDYPATALNIAVQAGLDTSGGVMTGTEIAALDDPQLQQRLSKTHVFCRVQPEQKLRLVTALKQAGDIVAMTGDGVNDAPALKAAHIGIAMGGRGTDVARESAALVLLDDDFGSIVTAVKSGRRIVENIRKAVVFVVAAHIPIAGMSMLPVMLGWPLILLPVHIVFFELMIDPTCSIVFEAEPAEANTMQRPPRNSTEKIFHKQLLLMGLKQGCALLAVLLTVYLTAKWAALPDPQVRALTFSAMIVGDIWLIFINRSWSLPLLRAVSLPNPALWWVVLSALLMLGLALFLPLLNTLFRFETPALSHIALTVLAVSASLFIVAWATKWQNKWQSKW
jgi:Ca2+-transporting ATPase